MPTGITGELATEAPLSQVTCESAVLPGLSIKTDDVRRYGYGVVDKKPLCPVFGHAQLVFRCGEDGRVYDYLHAWQQIAVNFEFRAGINTADGPNARYPYELSYKADYARDVMITAYAQSQNLIAVRTILRDAYPVDVQDSPVSWNSRGSYVRITALFAYADWARDVTLF